MQAEESKYFYFTRRVHFGVTGSYYRIQVKYMLNFNKHTRINYQSLTCTLVTLQMDTRSSLYNQILVPKLRTCEYDALPPPPAPPTTIAINNNSVQFQSVDTELGMGIMTLDLEWSRVAGNISSYEVRVIELHRGAEDASEANIQEVFQPDQLKVHVLQSTKPSALVLLSYFFLLQLSKESASLTVEVPSSTEDGCLYIQVSYQVA